MYSVLTEKTMADKLWLAGQVSGTTARTTGQVTQQELFQSYEASIQIFFKKRLNHEDFF